MDFTITRYEKLLESLQCRYSNFLTLRDFIDLDDKNLSVCILRHDVDLNPLNSYKMAKIENYYGIKGSYYFRITPNSYNLDIMKSIEDLGHEIGYHYEDVDIVYKGINQNKILKNKEFSRSKLIEDAYKNFCKNLEIFNENFKIKTICMHGSPLSKYDNKIIWEKFNYRDLGIIAEPYFDIDFSEFIYLTDTGRRWDGNKVSVRDKVDSGFNNTYKTTLDIIDDILNFPDRAMFTIHPQRWHGNNVLWIKELIAQRIKNKIKQLLLVK